LEAAKPNSRILMRAAANFASVYIETGQTTKAEHLLLRFIPLDGSFPQGPDGPVLVSDLASIRVRQGRFAEAEILFRRVIAQLSAGAPGEHREELATAMTDLSEVFQKTGRLPEALDWAGRSRRLVETMPNPMPMLVIKTLNNLAEISAQSGKPADAAPLYRQAIEYAERTLGPQHPVLGDILLNYANFLRQRKNGREARKVEKRANAIRERTRHDNLEGYTVEASSLVNPSQNGKVGAMALKP